jgi:D-arabinose 1-dehydrogenase-like Zn-dependent alcohol dehydrogenase
METQRKLSEILTEYIGKLQAVGLPFKALLVGPKEYILLKYELQGSMITDEQGFSELLTFMGVPVKIKTTQGIDLEIAPEDIGRYIGNSEGESKSTGVSNGSAV